MHSYYFLRGELNFGRSRRTNLEHCAIRPIDDKVILKDRKGARKETATD